MRLHAQLMWIESVLCQLWSASFFFWLVIFFGLVLSMKIQVELRLIAKGFIFEVSSQSLKRREAENYGGNNQSMRAAR